MMLPATTAMMSGRSSSAPRGRSAARSGGPAGRPRRSGRRRRLRVVDHIRGGRGEVAGETAMRSRAPSSRGRPRSRSGSAASDRRASSMRPRDRLRDDGVEAHHEPHRDGGDREQEVVATPRARERAVAVVPEQRRVDVPITESRSAERHRDRERELRARLGLFDHVELALGVAERPRAPLRADAVASARS